MGSPSAIDSSMVGRLASSPIQRGFPTSCTDLEKWLEQLNLSRHAAALQAAGVGVHNVHQLTEDTLRAAGISAVGHRRRILLAIEALEWIDGFQLPSRAAVPSVAADTDDEVVAPLGVGDSPEESELLRAAAAQFQPLRRADDDTCGQSVTDCSEGSFTSESDQGSFKSAAPMQE